MYKAVHIIKSMAITGMVVMLLGVSIIPPAGAEGEVPPEAEYIEQAGNVPTLLFPKGIIPIRKIVYVWTSVSEATKYQIQVYKGATVILNEIKGSSVCISGTCSISPLDILSDGSYQWHVRAEVSNAWEPYSSWQSFTIILSSGGFDSRFTSNTNGWSKHLGTWILENANYVTTKGIDDGYSSMSYMAIYPALAYQVRMKRIIDNSYPCGWESSWISIRGTPSPLDKDGNWNKEYRFLYSLVQGWSIDQMKFAVELINAGDVTILQDWTASAAIKGNDWNTLKVTAKGSQLKFYINGFLMWSGTDSTLATGKVGFGMFKTSSGSCISGKLLVDWAKLTTSVP
jgi:hypothetical protein